MKNLILLSILRSPVPGLTLGVLHFDCRISGSLGTIIINVSYIFQKFEAYQFRGMLIFYR